MRSMRLCGTLSGMMRFQPVFSQPAVLKDIRGHDHVRGALLNEEAGVFRVYPASRLHSSPKGIQSLYGLFLSRLVFGGS